MDVDKKRNEALLTLEGRAVEVLTDVLSGHYDGASDDGRIKIKVATSALGACAKNRQTLTAREAFRFSVAATVREDAAIKMYASASMPQVTKQLK